MRRDNIFFEEKFQAVGDRLKKTKWSDACRTRPHLDSRHNLPFDPRQVRKRAHDSAKDQDDLDHEYQEVGATQVFNLLDRAIFLSSQRRARSASPIGRSLKKSCADRSSADGVALRASPPLRGGEYPSRAASQFIQDLFGLAHVQVFVELTIDLHHRGRSAGSQAFELDCRKQTVSRDSAQFYAEFAFHTRLDFI